jgi:hypothetical protein
MSANQKQKLPMAVMFVNVVCLFGWGISEEKIKMWKDDGRQVMAKAHIAISKKSSTLKLLGQMDRNLVGSILGRSFIKIGNLVPIR